MASTETAPDPADEHAKRGNSAHLVGQRTCCRANETCMHLASARLPSADVIGMFAFVNHGMRAEDRFVRRLLDQSGRATGALSPVNMGRALLGLTGLLTTAAAPVLHLDARAWETFAAVSVLMIIALGCSKLVDWRGVPAPLLMVFPVLVFAAFATLGSGQRGVFAPLSGFFTLCYGYAGLTQRPRHSLLLVVPSSVALTAVYGTFDAEVAVRLVVATSVWMILAEVLAGFVARQSSMAAALQTAAHSDPLTGLANRRDLDLRLATCEPGTTLIVCDLDHFKRVNDTHGHSAGDRVLADFGGMLRAVLRDSDYCARFGGEEFVLVLPSTTPLEGELVLERLRLQWRLMQPTMTFSAGLAQCRTDRNAELTLIAADHALYEAKAAGRNTYRHAATPVGPNEEG